MKQYIAAINHEDLKLKSFLRFLKYLKTPHIHNDIKENLIGGQSFYSYVDFGLRRDLITRTEIINGKYHVEFELTTKGMKFYKMATRFCGKV